MPLCIGLANTAGPLIHGYNINSMYTFGFVSVMISSSSLVERIASVEMLDMTAFHNPAGEATGLRVKPFFKPTGRNIPLSINSAHSTGVHKWPIGEMARLASISSSRDLFNDARHKLLQHYRMHSVPNRVLTACEAFEFRPHFGARVASSVIPTFRTFTIVMTFNPWFVDAQFGKAMADVLEHFQNPLRSVFGQTIKCRIAFRNPGPHLVFRLRALSRLST